MPHPLANHFKPCFGRYGSVKADECLRCAHARACATQSGNPLPILVMKRPACFADKKTIAPCAKCSWLSECAMASPNYFGQYDFSQKKCRHCPYVARCTDPN